MLYNAAALNGKKVRRNNIMRKKDEKLPLPNISTTPYATALYQMYCEGMNLHILNYIVLSPNYL